MFLRGGEAVKNLKSSVQRFSLLRSLGNLLGSSCATWIADCDHARTGTTFWACTLVDPEFASEKVRVCACGPGLGGGVRALQESCATLFPLRSSDNVLGGSYATWTADCGHARTGTTFRVCTLIDPEPISASQELCATLSLLRALDNPFGCSCLILAADWDSSRV